MIHVEAKLLTIRGGVDFHKYGDPYDFCLSVFIDGDRAHLFGLCGLFTVSDAKKIKAALVKYGVVKAFWERKKGNRTKHVEVGNEE